MNDTLTFLILFAPVLAAAGGLIGAALVRSWSPAHELAVGGADYVEALKDAVNSAEAIGLATHIPGADKFGIAVRKMDDWLDAQGIHGDARSVTIGRVKADVELMRARLFPKKPV